MRGRQRGYLLLIYYIHMNPSLSKGWDFSKDKNLQEKQEWRPRHLPDIKDICLAKIIMKLLFKLFQGGILQAKLTLHHLDILPLIKILCLGRLATWVVR